AATPSLASLPIRGLMPSTTTPSFCRPDATFAGAPDHVRRSSGLPNTDVIATCSKRGLRKVVAPSRASVVSMAAGDIAAPYSASDQPVTRLFTDEEERHRLVTSLPMPKRRYSRACSERWTSSYR